MAKTAAQKRRREAEADQERQIDAQAPEQDGQSAAPPPSKKARTEEGRSLFVRGLPPSATTESLTEFFSSHYPIKHCTVVVDAKTKVSRGYGFVTFTDAEDTAEARNKLNNELMDGRRIRLDVAESRQRAAAKEGTAVTSRVAKEKKERDDARTEYMKPNKLIIRNLPWSVKTPEALESLFRMYGKVRYADIPQSKGKMSGFGFVTIKGRKNAEKALAEVNGKVVDGRTLAVDWAVDKQTWTSQSAEDADGAAKDDTPASRAEAQAKALAEDEDEEDADAKAAEDEESDEDMRNFMKNQLGGLDSEDDDEEDDDDEEEGDDEDEASDAEDAPSAKKLTDNSSTLFVRNLPYTATDEALKTFFGTFGAVRYARIVMDRATDRPAGTGFVCFFNQDDSTKCLLGAPRFKAATDVGKQSVLQNDAVDPDGNYTMDGRILRVSQAVSKEQATKITEEGPAGRLREEKDKRRLYLLSEGTIPASSPLHSILPAGEIKMREASAVQRKKLIQSNPSLHLSLTRLSIRNIPSNLNSKDLKALARDAYVGFAKDVKDGKREPLSKEELARGGQADKDAEHRRKEKGVGVVKQAKVVFESKEGSKLSEDAGAGKSRGYGFIEYTSHRCALMALRWLNGHAPQGEGGKGGKPQRLIAEFAIENANVVSRRSANEGKARRGELVTKKQGGVAREPGLEKTGGGRAARNAARKKAKGGKAGKEQAEETKVQGEPASKKDKAGAKLALRQQIIGRKRMMRKKKTESRRAK